MRLTRRTFETSPPRQKHERRCGRRKEVPSLQVANDVVEMNEVDVRAHAARHPRCARHDDVVADRAYVEPVLAELLRRSFLAARATVEDFARAGAHGHDLGGGEVVALARQRSELGFRVGGGLRGTEARAVIGGLCLLRGSRSLSGTTFSGSARQRF